ncbi:MAG: hypothetical protein MI757_02145, partial [Pirellulales bacterium]|nr:hypothetical protein [Pirellulales bacterium]
TLVFENQTSQYHTARVNGIRYSLRPGISEIRIRRGPTNVELIGFESPKRWNTWRWTGRNYELRILIKERPRVWHEPWITFASH